MNVHCEYCGEEIEGGSVRKVGENGLEYYLHPECLEEVQLRNEDGEDMSQIGMGGFFA
jgi:hypothetical protein